MHFHLLVQAKAFSAREMRVPQTGCFVHANKVAISAAIGKNGRVSRRPAGVDPVPGALAEVALTWVGTWLRNPFEPLASDKHPGRPHSFLSMVLVPLALEARVLHPDLAISLRTVRRRAAVEGWDEWWLLARMRERAKASTSVDDFFRYAFEDVLCADSASIELILEHSSGQEFPAVLRRRLVSPLVPIPLFDGTLVDASSHANDLVLFGERFELVDFSSALERCRVAPVKLQSAPLAEVGSALRTPSPSEAREIAVLSGHLEYWKSRVRDAKGVKDRGTRTRMEAIAWLISNDQPWGTAASIPEFSRLSQTLAAERTKSTEIKELNTRIDQAVKTRISYVYGWDEDSCDFVEDYWESIGWLRDAPFAAAQSILGAIDRMIDSNPRLPPDLAVSQVREWCRHAEAQVELSAAIVYAAHGFALRAMKFPQLGQALTFLLEHPGYDTPDDEMTVSRGWPATSTTESVQREIIAAGWNDFQHMSQDGYEYEPVSPLAFPRIPLALAAAFALDESPQWKDREVTAPTRTKAAIEVPRWLRAPREGPSAAELDRNLRKLVLGRPQRLLETMVFTPGLVAALMCSDDELWTVRREPEYLKCVDTLDFDERSIAPWEDAFLVWKTMHSIDYRAHAPLMDRRILAGTTSRRIEILLTQENQRRRSVQVSESAISRTLKVLNDLSQMLEIGRELSDEQMRSIRSALQRLDDAVGVRETKPFLRFRPPTPFGGAEVR